MFERSTLEELAAFEGTQPVVSLYLNLAPRLRGTPEAYRARLKGLLKEAAGRAAEEDIAAIEDYFDKTFDWVGRSVAVFSGQADGLWFTQSFAVPVRSSVTVGEKPFLMPLAHLLDTYGSYSVALVEQQSIRMFQVNLGEMIDSKTVEGEEVKRLKSGGGAAGRSRGRGEAINSATQTTIRSNLKEFADDLVTFCKRHKSEHILLGGTETTVHAFEEMLGPPCKDRVEGMFTISMHASEAEVLEQSLEAMLNREAARESELAEQVQALAARGANGVVGIEPTLQAAKNGRVQTLVLVEDALPPDVSGPAIAHVVDMGGEVEFVGTGSPLDAHGGIGALLRY